jgi:hypothetical protein
MWSVVYWVARFRYYVYIYIYRYIIQRPSVNIHVVRSYKLDNANGIVV